MSEVEYSVVDLGAVTAYAQAVENGYTGTLEQWAQLQINSANNYQELFNEIYTKDSSAALWEQGGFSASSGATSSSTTRIRTTDFLPDSIAKIMMNTGYYIMLYAYKADGTFGGVLRNNYNIDGNSPTVDFRTDTSYVTSCITGSLDLRGIKNVLRETDTEGVYTGVKFKVAAAFGVQGTTAITPDVASNITFYENNVGYAVDNDLIGIGEDEPDSNRAVLWIDNESAMAVQIPQIDDDNVSDVDTWSSEKINSELSQISEEIDYNLNDYLSKIYIDNSAQLWDRFRVKKGEYIQCNGVAVESSTWRHLTIPVIAGHTYYFAKPDPTTSSGVTTGSAGYVAFIKLNGEYYDSSATANQWKNSITVPDGVVYMVVSIPDSRLYGEEYSVIDGVSNTNNAFNPWEPRYNKTYIDNTNGSNYRISCVGDSITDGVGGNGTDYPSVLAGEDSNLEVFKFGYPSEDSLYISAMCGATGLYVDPFTVPASNSFNAAPAITIRLVNGSTLVLDHISVHKQCIIGGIEGYLDYDNGDVKFTRAKAGDPVTFDGPQILIQNYEMRHKGDILLLWAGTNDASIPDMNATLFYQIDTIINNLQHKKYLILGVMNSEKFTNIDNVTIYYRRHYGNHYVNIRQYLLDYGLADAEITPTEQDETDIANGMIPQSLRPSGDTYHLNADGYTVVGKYLYKYIKQLGWID